MTTTPSTSVTPSRTDVHIDCDRPEEALECLADVGYCVLRGMIDADFVQQLKNSIDEHLDPDGDLPPASNRYHMVFAEVSEPLWKLLEHEPYRRFERAVHRTDDLCLHRSAAILRTAGEAMGSWHTDHRGHVERPRNANEVLNRFPIPSGAWFYLNGSHAGRSGIAVIEGSHRPDWEGPEGFELTPDRFSFRRRGDADGGHYAGMDVPGCVGVVAEPGDLICFAALTYHANMATYERRYSCAMGLRPRAWRIDAPWPLSGQARAMVARLPAHLRPFTDGYTSYDGSWRGPDA